MKSVYLKRMLIGLAALASVLILVYLLFVSGYGIYIAAGFLILYVAPIFGEALEIIYEAHKEMKGEH
jgi:hypothetical protein